MRPTCASRDLTGTMSLAALVRECALSFHQESESQQRVWTLHCTRSCEQSPGHLFQEPSAKAVTPGPQTATQLAPWVGDRQHYQPIKSLKGWAIVAVETLIGGPNLIYRLIYGFLNVPEHPPNPAPRGSHRDENLPIKRLAAPCLYNPPWSQKWLVKTKACCSRDVSSLAPAST